MIVIVQGPPASGKTTLAKRISERFRLPHISRDILQEWMSKVDDANNQKIMSFCAHAGYKLMFDLAGELSKGAGGFIIEGCMNPKGAALQMKDKLAGTKHEIVEVFVTASNDVLVQRYLDRAGTESRHSAHGNESTRGEKLARHLEEVIYTPMRIGKVVLEIDNTKDFQASTNRVLAEIGKLISV